MTRQNESGGATAATRRSNKKKSKKNREPETKIIHNGFEYTKAWTSNRKMVFRCSVYRSAECSARLAIRPTVKGYELVNTHTCIEPICSSTDIVDCTTEMKNRVDVLSIADLTVPVHVIWQQVKAEFYPVDDVIRKGLSEEQVKRRVYRGRQMHYGAYLLGQIEVPPLSMIEGKNLSFFQFHLSRPKADPTAKADRLIGWSHPELRQLLMYNGVSIFFDGTFRCVPTELKQCMVLMVHDQASELFIPVYFVLCTSKENFDILELIYRDTSEKLEPCDVVCDFEQPLIDAVEKQFPNAEVVGCLFHFKQAVRRRVKTVHCIPEQEISIAMEKGVLDVLTVIDPELVPRQGIRWVKRTIRERCAADGIPYTRAKWKPFWGYFRATWIERYKIEVWNAHGMQNSLVARTNNPLERFHRELNRAFPTPHPKLATFVTVIRTISQDYVDKLASIAQGRRKRGNKRNAKKRKGSRNGNSVDAHYGDYDLPNPVVFTEADAAEDSESEEEMSENENTSDEEIGNESDNTSEVEEICNDQRDDFDVLLDFSFEPSEYCEDNEEAVV